MNSQDALVQFDQHRRLAQIGSVGAGLPVITGPFLSTAASVLVPAIVQAYTTSQQERTKRHAIKSMERVEVERELTKREKASQEYKAELARTLAQDRDRHRDHELRLNIANNMKDEPEPSIRENVYTMLIQTGAR